MSRLAVIATIEVPSERRHQLLPLLIAHRDRCLKDEPEITLQFDILLPPDDKKKVLSYEVYRDDTAFDAHRNGSSICAVSRRDCRTGCENFSDEMRNYGLVDSTIRVLHKSTAQRVIRTSLLRQTQ